MSDTAAPRRPGRVLLIVGAVSAGLVLVVGVFLGYKMSQVPRDSLDPLEPGALTVDVTPDEPVRFGPFTAAISVGDQPGIVITQGTDGRVVWRSVPGVAFVGAGVGSVDFTEHLGYFWADVSRDAEMTEQSIADVSRQPRRLVISGTVSGDGRSAPYTMSFQRVVKAVGVTALGIRLDVGATSGGPVSSVLLTGSSEGEAVHGLGEQYRNGDLTGSVIPILPREQGMGRGEQPISVLADLTNWAGGNQTTTYAAWPAYVTDMNRALTFDDVPESGVFTVADLSQPGQISLEAWGPALRVEALAASTTEELLRQRAAGMRRPGLADWVQRGAVLGLQGGTQRVRRIVGQMQEAGTELSAVWLQDWTGKRQTSFGDRLWWTWQLDRTRYPGWDEMVADFREQDIQVLTYMNPWLVDPTPKQDGQPDRNLYAEAEAAGYVVRTSDGEPYLMDQNGFDAVLVDFTNPAARDWYAEIIADEVLGAGASGFMADFGEALPYDAVLAEGSPATEHNRWPQLWAETVREGCQRAGQPNCVTFMRAAFLGSAEYVPLMWAGDQMVDFSAGDGLASAIFGMLDSGVSGMPLTHSDIGGYTSINAVVKNYVRPPDLNQRWAEMQSLAVLMRTHEGNRPAENAQVYDTPESRAAFARSSQLYAALYDYRRTVIEAATRDGIPAMRPMWMHGIGDPGGYNSTQFFLGDHLLVAPVTQEGATTVDVEFPAGTWIHVLTGQTYIGSQTTEVDAPLGTPAAFVQQGDATGEQILQSIRDAGLATD